MIIASGVVRHGKVELEPGSLPEGARATVLVAEGDETFEATPGQEALLLEAIAEAERGELIPAADVLAELKKV
jgi:hypothetical protein